MKYNDLRIMNHVKCTISNDNGIYQVIGIDAMNNICLLNGAREADGWIPFDKIRPIVLTPEIMLECGFSFIDGGIGWDSYSKGLLKLTSIPAKTKNMVLGYYLGDSYRYVRYVHELENIYYALIGTEL